MLRYRTLHLLACAIFLFNAMDYTDGSATAQEGLVTAVSNTSAAPIRVGTALQLNAEAKIRSELDDMTIVEFIDTPLEDVLTYLEDYHEIEIEIDQRAFDKLGIVSCLPINRNLHGISLRSALSLILSSVDLTYLVEDEVLLITTIEEAETHLHAVVYPVGELIRPAGDPSDPFTRQQKGLCLDDLIEIIRTMADPFGWGEGTGMFAAFGNHLVIQQTEPAHQEIESLLRALHQAAK